MSGDVTIQALKRQSFLPDRPEEYQQGTLIAGQDYDNVYIRGGSISGVDLGQIEGVANGGTVSRPYEDYFGDTLNAKDFGAVGNGIADDTAALQIAANTGRPLVLTPGTYKLSGNGITITAALLAPFGRVVLDMSACNALAAGVNAFGSQGNFYNLVADSSEGATTLTTSAADLSASGIAANDWVMVKSETVFDPTRTASKIAELVQVASVNTGTGAITLAEPLTHTYTVAASAKFSKVTLRENIRILGDIQIKAGNDITKNHVGFRMIFCNNPVTNMIGAQNIDRAGIQFWSCVRPQGNLHSFRDFKTSTTGYGISFGGCTRDALVTNISGHQVRHLVTTQNSNSTLNGLDLTGIPNRCITNGFVLDGTIVAQGGSMQGGDGIDTHAAALEQHYWNGVIRNCAGQGANFECPSGSAVNLEVTNANGNGYQVHNETARNGRWRFVNCKAKKIKVIGLVAGNGFSLGDGNPNVPFDILDINELVSEDCDGYGVYIRGTTAQPLTNLSAANIHSYRCGKGNLVSNCNGGTVSNMNAYQIADTQYANRITDCKDTNFNGVFAEAVPNATGGGALFIEANTAGSTNNITVSSLRAKAATPTLFYGVYIDDNATGVTIAADAEVDQASVPYRLGAGLGHKIYSGVGSALTAAGTTAADALQLTGSSRHFINNVATGTGVKLGTARRFSVTVANKGTNALLVYPPTGARINALATDAGFSLAVGASAVFVGTSATQWYTA